VFLAGCPGWWGSSSTENAAPTPITIEGLDEFEKEDLEKALACVFDNTVTITGNYQPSGGTMLGINREVKISSAMFKVAAEGQDELAEAGDEARVENWEADFVRATKADIIGSGINEELCFQLEYRRGPFDGPGGRCSLFAKGKICDQCTVKETSWELRCGVDEQGNGGEARATGSWGLNSP
jgi:hypothetical protein